MDEAVWKTATKMELKYEKSPGDDTPSPVKTEVFFMKTVALLMSPLSPMILTLKKLEHH